MLTHRAPSVGSLIKKIVEINPTLTTSEIIGLVRHAVENQGGNGEFNDAEMVNEDLALQLARETLVNQAPEASRQNAARTRAKKSELEL